MVLSKDYSTLHVILEHDVDELGVLRVKSVALAEGIWSGVFYSYDEIKKSVNKLKGVPMLVEHGLSDEFGAKDVGKVVSVIANDDIKGIIAISTAEDNKVKEFIKSGKLSAVSVRVFYEYNPDENKADGTRNAKNLTYGELSYVVKPMCKVCMIQGYKTNSHLSTKTDTPSTDIKMTDPKEAKEALSKFVEEILSGKCEHMLSEHLPNVMKKLKDEGKLQGWNAYPGVPDSLDALKKFVTDTIQEIMAKDSDVTVKLSADVKKLSDEFEEINKSMDQIKSEIEGYKKLTQKIDAGQVPVVSTQGSMSAEASTPPSTPTPPAKTIDQILEETKDLKTGDLIQMLHDSMKEKPE